MSTLLGFFAFFSDIIKLIKVFQSTPLEKREALRKEIDNAFNKAKSGDPSGIADLINK